MAKKSLPALILADRKAAKRCRVQRLRRETIIRNALCERLSEAAVVALFAVPLGAIRRPHRSVRKVSEARQAGMYLVHTVFSARFTRAGRVFGRDRTTARHACRRVEEWRERPGFDAALDRLEPSLRLWISTFLRLSLDEGEQ